VHTSCTGWLRSCPVGAVDDMDGGHAGSFAIAMHFGYCAIACSVPWLTISELFIRHVLLRCCICLLRCWASFGGVQQPWLVLQAGGGSC
jgi:hypothetical protein